MVPTRWVVLAALPRLPSGKLDRAALPPPHEERPRRALYEAPRTDSERALAGICAEVLHLPRVGIHDNLFEAGADSLSVQVIANRAARAGLALPLSRLPSLQTIAALSSGAQDPRAKAPSLSPPR